MEAFQNAAKAAIKNITRNTALFFLTFCTSTIITVWRRQVIFLGYLCSRLFIYSNSFRITSYSRCWICGIARFSMFNFYRFITIEHSAWLICCTSMGDISTAMEAVSFFMRIYSSAPLPSTPILGKIKSAWRCSLSWFGNPFT